MKRITLLQRKFKTLTSLLASCLALVNAARKWLSWWERRNSYILTIDEGDPFYHDIFDWLVTMASEDEDHKQMLIKYDPEVHAVYDGTTTQVIDFEGHPVKVTVRRPQSYADAVTEDLLIASGNAKDISSKLVNRGFTKNIEFVARNKAGQKAVLTRLEVLRKQRYDGGKREPRMYVLGGYNQRTVNVPPRDIKTVVLAEGQMERILADTERFFKSEKEYVKRGIPWHRGYLFEGPPGTGKSSLAKALAYHFGVDLYYYPLGNVTNDANLNTTFRDVPRRSIILLEDVDVFGSMRNRDEDRRKDKDSFSLSGLLNVLDGVMTPEGVVIIMTTNNKDALDDAILRPGRCDLIERLDVLCPSQADAMFQNFFGEDPAAPLGIEGLPPAFMIEVMRNHMYDPCAAEEALRQRYKEKIAA